PVNRTLSCPSRATFADLHHALQIVFGWAKTHTYDFKIKDPDYGDARAREHFSHQIDSYAPIQMRAESPPTPPEDSPRKYLLRIVECKKDNSKRGMGFATVDSFLCPQRKHPRTLEKTATSLQLCDVLEDLQYNGLELEYEYNFGECWHHCITLEGRADPTSHFLCLDGEGHGVAEDVGGIRGWEELKEAYRAAVPTEEQREKMHWYETQAINGDKDGLSAGNERRWKRNSVNRQL
ncbi:hypothetical protein M501DRAFT_918381, partial [Patellaria atrata CBS 101060]